MIEVDQQLTSPFSLGKIYRHLIQRSFHGRFGRTESFLLLLLCIRRVRKQAKSLLWSLLHLFFPASQLRELRKKFKQKQRKLVSTLFLTHMTFASSTIYLANQKKEFKGVQSKLQSKLNYRSNNMRLEMKFISKSDKIKDFQGFYSFFLSFYRELKNFCQKFGKKHIEIQIF